MILSRAGLLAACLLAAAQALHTGAGASSAPATGHAHAQRSRGDAAATAGVAQAVPVWACRDSEALGVALNTSAGMLHNSTTLRRSEEAIRQQPGLTVGRLDSYLLAELLAVKEKALMLVFYAPWCLHCRNFVMADASGNASGAPLELFSQRMQAAQGPSVYSFDTTKSDPPLAFRAPYVPRIYTVTTTGVTRLYQGNPHDIPALQAFAMQAVAPQAAFLRHSAAAAAKVARPAAMPAWACPLASTVVGGSEVALHSAEERSTSSPAAVALFGAQNVTAVEAASLSKLVVRQSRLLVVFYAPWCPHCQSFVIADKAGNKTNAPLEVLKRRLLQKDGPAVVKYDTTQGPAPPAFKFQYIPSTFLVTEAGMVMTFKGNPSKLNELENFALTPAHEALAAP